MFGSHRTPTINREKRCKKMDFSKRGSGKMERGECFLLPALLKDALDAAPLDAKTEMHFNPESTLGQQV